LWSGPDSNAADMPRADWFKMVDGRWPVISKSFHTVTRES
jgi:hypothetical protein